LALAFDPRIHVIAGRTSRQEHIARSPPTAPVLAGQATGGSVLDAMKGGDAFMPIEVELAFRLRR